MPVLEAPAPRADRAPVTALRAPGTDLPAAPALDPAAALRAQACYDAAEPALHAAALASDDPLAFLEATLALLGRTADAARARALLAEADGASLVTVAVWGDGAAVPEGLELAAFAPDGPRAPVLLGDVEAGARLARGLQTLLHVEGAVLVPFRDDARVGAFLLERPADAAWDAAEVPALARFARLFETLWAWTAAQARHRLTLADLEDGLFNFGWDAEGRRRYALATPPFEALVGCAAADLAAADGGAPAVDWRSLVAAEDLERFDRHEAALQAGEPDRLVYRLRRPLDGEVRWVRESATPGRSPSGRPVVGGLLSDVTEAKRAEASLVQAKQAAERASHARTAFLATMSHEIRSPLGAVRGFAELLGEEVRELAARGGDLPPEIEEFAGIISENAHRALHLVHRLFDLSRLETGALALRSLPVELHPAVERVLARYAAEAESKGLALRFERAEADPVLLADPERVEEVVEHLVSNAVKFTETGAIAVTTAVEADAVRLVVEDTGVGIAAEYLAGLFEPFSQEDYRLNRKYGGSGLGLAIAKRLLDGMGGQLRVESEKGRGSRFEVVFGARETGVVEG